jgi:uncharacterized protein GlcG (DUF336 family)
MLAGAGMELTLLEADAIIASAIGRANALNLHISVAVCGLNGRLVAFSKMNGAGCMSARPAIGKAVASSISGQNSEVLPGADNTPGSATVEAEGMAAFHAPGGLALMRDGTLIGAIGVFGDATPDQDVACGNRRRLRVAPTGRSADGATGPSRGQSSERLSSLQTRGHVRRMASVFGGPHHVIIVSDRDVLTLAEAGLPSR